MAGSLLRKFGRGLALVGLELRVVLFGKQLKSSTTAPTDGQALVYVAADDAWSPGTVSGGGSLPAGTNGGVLRYASGAWASTAAGTSGQVLRSAGASAPTWATLAAADVGALAATNANEVGALRVAYTGGTALPADAALGLGWTTRSIVVRSSPDGAWLDVWRVNGSGFWTFGSTSASSGGVVQLAPAGGEIYLRRGTDDYLGVNSSGDLMLGFSTKPTTLRGSAITITTAPVVAIDDATTNAATTALTLRHTTSGTAAAGIGTRLLLQSEDAGGTTEDVAALDAVLTNAGAATEAGALDVSTRTAGGALRRTVRAWGSGSLWVGSQATAYDGGDGTVTLPNAGGYCVESGGTVYQILGRFGGANLVFGNGSFATNVNAFSLSFSAGQGTTITNGWLDLSCGFRRRRTAISNANHTVTASQSVIDMTGLNAARVITGPAAVDGAIVTIENSDGTASVTNTLTFTPATGTVNGAASHVGVNAAYGSCTYHCNGTNWTVIAKV